MNRFSLICFLSLFIAEPAVAIVTGSPVSDEQFADDYPWVVAIVTEDGNGICGGVLIAPRLVLTAAHCTGGKKYVLVGNADRTQARKVEIKGNVRHPEFDLTTWQNDLAVLFLTEAVDITLAPLATVAEARVLLQSGSTALITGWGVTSRSKVPAERLLIEQTTLGQLGMRGSQYIYKDPQTGPCALDSGGPMLKKIPAGLFVVTGIASATDGNLCSKGGGIAIYTNVSLALDFINVQIERFPKN
jgi:secreted trypsin-like serine protease